jgi:hypothetical protein
MTSESSSTKTTEEFDPKKCPYCAEVIKSEAINVDTLVKKTV